MTDRHMPPGVSEGGGDATVLPGAASGASLALMGGRYRVERVIGEGAFGRVYLAVDARLRRNVAIKELLASRNRADADVYARYLERFQREARAAGVVQHPNIVAVLELAIDTEENHYLVMEYIDGTDLRDLLAQVRTLPVERAVRITLEVARALEAVHEMDIVHRDLKPANIMLTRRGVTKLADFGVAQVGHESQRTQISAGGHPGTPLYMSPEQSAGHGYLDGRSDLYSLGLILYEMLAGEPYARRRRPLGAVRPDISPELVTIFRRLTEKDADARYTDAGAVVIALSRLSTAPPASTALDLPALPPGGAGSRSRSADSGSRASASPPSASSGAPAPPADTGSRSRSGVPVVTPPSHASGEAAPVAARGARRGKVGVLLGVGGGILIVGVLVMALTTGVRGHTGPTPTPAQVSTPTALPLAARVIPATSTVSEPTATPTPPATPTATPAPATPAGGDGTNLSQWAVSEAAGLYRRSFDPAAGEYHVILLRDNVVQPILTPETQSIADLSIEVDVRHVTGPDAGGFGVAFRVQPFATGDKSHAAYIFVIDGQQRYALYQMKGDGTAAFVQPLTPLPAGTMHVGPNAVNHLTVVCRGGTITLAVNGTTLNTYPAAITGPGSIGLAVEAPAGASGVEVAFRNLRISPA